MQQLPGDGNGEKKPNQNRQNQFYIQFQQNKPSAQIQQQEIQDKESENKYEKQITENKKQIQILNDKLQLINLEKKMLEKELQVLEDQFVILDSEHIQLKQDQQIYITELLKSQEKADLILKDNDNLKKKLKLSDHQLKELDQKYSNDIKYYLKLLDEQTTEKKKYLSRLMILLDQRSYEKAQHDEEMQQIQQYYNEILRKNTIEIQSLNQNLTSIYIEKIQDLSNNKYFDQELMKKIEQFSNQILSSSLQSIQQRYNDSFKQLQAAQQNALKIIKSYNCSLTICQEELSKLQKMQENCQKITVEYLREIENYEKNEMIQQNQYFRQQNQKKNEIIQKMKQSLKDNKGKFDEYEEKLQQYQNIIQKAEILEKKLYQKMHQQEEQLNQFREQLQQRRRNAIQMIEI